MSGVKARLDYLTETKSKIKEAINNLGGNIDDTMAFDEYPAEIDKLIETEVIPQATLDNLVSNIGNINGEVVK